MEQDRIYRGQIYYIHPQEVVGSEQRVEDQQLLSAMMFVMNIQGWLR